MNKQQIVSYVQSLATILGVETNHLVVTAGAAAVLHGLREETEDVDLDVSSRTWELLCLMFGKGSIKEGICGEVYHFGANADIHRNPAVEDGIAVTIEGLQVLNLEGLRAQYLALMENPKRMPEKVKRDKETVVAIQRKLDDEYNNRSLKSSKETIPLFKNILGMKGDLLRLRNYFCDNPDRIVPFADDEERVWFASRVNSTKQDMVINLRRTSNLTPGCLLAELMHPTTLIKASREVAFDSELEMVIRL